MNKDLDKLLNNLSPVIEKKCIEINNKKEKRRQSILMIILCLCFITVPSILLLLNINIIYFIIVILIISLLNLFIKLPDILKKDLEVTHYEQYN